MSRNGFVERTLLVPLAPEELADARETEQQHRESIFGSERMAAEQGDPATPELADQLAWQIEEVCTYDASNWKGVLSKTVYPPESNVRTGPIELTWNPAGIAGGFGSIGNWDVAVASINGTHQERLFRIPSGGRFITLPHKAREGIFVDRDSGLAVVKRSIWPIVGNNPTQTAYKQASATEVDHAMRLLSSFDKPTSNDQPPVYLEVGPGLDPASLLGRRAFKDKAYVGIDNAVGSYQNVHGDYPNAVVNHSAEFMRQMRTRPGQHIQFMLGDGGRLPFPQRRIREVFLSNVLNANLDDTVRSAIAQEANRVLEPGGNLVVRANWHQDQWPVSHMIRFLESQGYDIPRTVDNTDVEYQRLEDQYGTPSDVVAPDGYYVIAQPLNR